jgi:SAM-dependent methyltransferase
VSVNPYDRIPYSTLARQKTHPDRLASVAALFGMKPAPVSDCRVLEIGCGTGNNLIPMAYWLPRSRFVGIDLAEEPIAVGRRAVKEIGLNNISLRAADLCAFGSDAGTFDFIIAHGVYSWVPQAVRDRLMEVCRDLLNPQGVAFISYNAYPGRHFRLMLREMLLYHTRNSADDGARIREGRAFLELLQNSHILSREWAELLETEVKALLKHEGGGLFHDDLASINDSVYFRDFAAHAAPYGLQYLGEADLEEMFDHNRALPWLKDDVLEREQYLDFLKLRRFRQTLLCHEAVALERDLDPAIMERFHFSAPGKEIEGGQLEGLHGIRISALQDSVRRVALAMGEIYPLPASFDELLPYAGDRSALGEIMLALVTGGFADLHVHDFPCADTVSEKPRASRLVRYELKHSPYVTSVAHHMIQLGEIDRYLLPLVDGTRTQLEIARELAAMAGAPGTEEIMEHLPKSLEWFAREGLLEG